MVLAGPNGGGKSSILRAIATIDQPSSGSIVMAGWNVSARRQRRQARRQLGYVPQSADFPHHFTGRQAVSYGAWLSSVDAAVRDEAVSIAMRSFDAEHLADRRLGRMSVGERQRVLLAQATVHDPTLLVLDEPTAAVDPEHRAHLRRLLRRWASDRLVLVATHLVEEIELLADLVVVMVAGRQVFRGELPDLARLGVEGGVVGDERPVEAALRCLRAAAGG